MSHPLPDPTGHHLALARGLTGEVDLQHPLDGVERLRRGWVYTLGREPPKLTDLLRDVVVRADVDVTPAAGCGR